MWSRAKNQGQVLSEHRDTCWRRNAAGTAQRPVNTAPKTWLLPNIELTAALSSLFFCICVTVSVSPILQDVQCSRCDLVGTSDAAGKKESAVPVVVISACTIASTRTLPCNQSVRFPRAAISMCRPPNTTTNLSSPYISDHFHWICLAMAYKGWSNVTTGVCLELRCFGPSCLYTSVQVSHEQWCLTLADAVGPSRRQCLTLLNFSSWRRWIFTLVSDAWTFKDPVYQCQQ